MQFKTAENYFLSSSRHADCERHSTAENKTLTSSHLNCSSELKKKKNTRENHHLIKFLFNSHASQPIFVLYSHCALPWWKHRTFQVLISKHCMPPTLRAERVWQHKTPSLNFTLKTKPSKSWQTKFEEFALLYVRPHIHSSVKPPIIQYTHKRWKVPLRE